MQERAPGLHAGAASVEITPETPVPMAGYIRRARPAQGVHDPLFARALVLAAGEQRLAIISLDVVGIDKALSDRVRGEVAAVLAVPEQDVLVAATHTHSGPDGIFADRADFLSDLAGRLSVGAVAAARRAWHGLAPARIGLGQALVPGIAANRDDPALPVDQRVRVLRVSRPDGSPLCLVVHFACHGTVLNHTNLLLSGDFPGLAMGLLEKQEGTALFLNGAAGDVSTRFTRRSATFAEAQRLAGLLAEGADLAARDARMWPDVRLTAARRVLVLPPAEPLSADRLDQVQASAETRLQGLQTAGGRQGEMRRMEALLEGLQVLRAERQAPPTEPVPFEIQALRLGNTVLVAAPAELFTATARAIEEAAAGKGLEPLVVSYANGYIGYVPDEQPGAELNYEALVSPLAPGSAARIVEGARQLLDEIGRN